jgi:hydroxymethylpyrimidine/phosphomethylpyrimidine kinase
LKTVLTIAGSDCSGGAGIQADLKTITVYGMYGMSVITALTAQNTTGVYGIEVVNPEFVEKQLDCIFMDIHPDAIKIGMVSNSAIIEVIAKKLLEYHASNIVVDPVMVATSGSKLLNEHAIQALITKLLPLGSIITPNRMEAEVLCGFPIRTKEEMSQAARTLAKLTKGGILIKGGHIGNSADDLLFANDEEHWFYENRVENPNTHGTGCTLSTAIACNLAAQYSLPESVQMAKAYLTGALKAGLDLGKGSGPLMHNYK